jgi:hypothetical protein
MKNTAIVNRCNGETQHGVKLLQACVQHYVKTG